MSSEARLEILTRINRATSGHPPALERPPIPTSTRPSAEILAQFAEYAAEYRAHVQQMAQADIPEALAKLLAGKRVLVPEGLPAAWRAALDSTPDNGQSHAELTHFQAVLTTCAVAIAETGTVVLDHGSGQGRRTLTLIPDQHVCVVFWHQIVESVPEGVATLQEAVTAGRPLTWISGPSATSDIELSRVEGVHGPRSLNLFIITPGD
ncbi:LUD domain-containing protein [Deinococcus sp. QL22]|uniref:LutC/YkgG family protein n=1 Tax=Deinococcus sp. QL22 TaxID=2939437 RepID=UPI0020183681|nr:LUD domain-containing protein [Deinococcus sp. QL22]UQN08385.1 LUD domain-containing protein [Deinococcus sp. QL22]